MNKRMHLINKVKSFEEKFFNEDQKTIAIKILENAPENEVQAYADFIFMKRRTGFGFDYSPEIAKGRLITLREDIKRRINVGNEVEADENKLIIGDNYNALKSLLVTHKNKIDIIYIDPPYNTEVAKKDGNQSSKNGQASKFFYKDKFGRGGWLNMMKSRLELAKVLLTNEGIIFISIDDSEQAYLKILMDDIFGESNFVSNIYWRSRTSQNYSDKHISDVGEYILVYAKEKIILPIFNKNKSSGGNNYSNPDNDPNGDWTSSGIIRDDGRSIYEVISPTGKRHKQAFLFTKKNFLKLNSEGKIWWGKNGDAIPRKKSYLKDWNGNPYISAIINSSISNDLARKNLNKIIDPFYIKKHTPKPIDLIKLLINLIKNKNLAILDFFAGSGTTAHAIMELNKEDGGNRKFILCTNNENKIAHNVTYERLHRIIKGKGTNNESDFKWIKDNNPYSHAKLRVINIDDQINIQIGQKISYKVYQDCQNGLKLLDQNYKKMDINLYYDLAALNPLKNEDDKY